MKLNLNGVTQPRYEERWLLRCPGRGLAGISWYFLVFPGHITKALEHSQHWEVQLYEFCLSFSCMWGRGKRDPTYRKKLDPTQEKLECVWLKGKRPQKIEEG